MAELARLLPMIGGWLTKKIYGANEAGQDFIARRLGAGFRPGMRVLDVGCGDGRATRRMLARCDLDQCTVFGIDMAPPRAVDGLLQYTQAELDHQRLPYDDARFDAVISNQVIEHLLYKDYFLEECRRVLVPGGLLMVATENIASLDNVLSLLVGQEPFSQHTSTKQMMANPWSPFFGKTPAEHLGFGAEHQHAFHKNVSSYYGLRRLLEINGFPNAELAGFGHVTGLFEKLLPWQCRVIVAWAMKEDA